MRVRAFVGVEPQPKRVTFCAILQMAGRFSAQNRIFRAEKADFLGSFEGASLWVYLFGLTRAAVLSANAAKRARASGWVLTTPATTASA